jgi:hypothetical protein
VQAFGSFAWKKRWEPGAVYFAKKAKCCDKIRKEKAVNRRAYNFSRALGLLFFISTIVLPVLAPPETGAANPDLTAGRDNASAFVTPPPWTGHINYVFGYKWLEKGWSPAGEQVEFGLVDFDCRKEGWPVSLAGQLLLTYAGNVPRGLAGNNSGTYELNLGVRKVWEDRSALHPFAGGGVSLIGATNSSFIRFNDGGSAQVNEHSAAAAGVWADAGFYWILSDHWHTGAQLQYSWGELRLGGRDLDAGGLHLLGMLGYRWR